MDRLPYRSLTLPPDNDYPFYILASCYPHPNFKSPHRDHAPLTLILLHSTSFHKEALEPMLNDLFEFTSSRTDIREAWIIECPNHGESAVLNQSTLDRPEYQRFFSCERYAEAAYRFLTADTIAEDGPQARIETDRVVGVGHSLGGCGIILLAGTLPIFTSLVLLDPFLLPDMPEEIQALRCRLVNSAQKRRDQWPSRQHARRSFQRNHVHWDERVLHLYVTHGLRAPAQPHTNDSSDESCTLACTRQQEVTMYTDPDGATKPVDILTRLCTQLPVHVAFGRRDDIIPRRAQDLLVDTSVRRFASVAWIEGTGHLIPQENPQGAANFIAKALQQNATHRL
ncbi:alpha/beta-hydrolase [Trametopsis cervina]|nr:alpha/beta-hydrolase [Trametopsis cervina]